MLKYWENPPIELEKMTDELMPIEGKADTVAGEIIRAINRIYYRYGNDGDVIGLDCGMDVNPPARYLMENTNEKISHILNTLWGEYDMDLYENGLDHLTDEVLNFLKENPELKTTQNNDDFFNYRQLSDYYCPEDDEEDEDIWDDEYVPF